MMENPDTEAVILPRVIAASADVDRCPMVTTEAMTKLYSSKCVLGRAKVSAGDWGNDILHAPKHRRGILGQNA